MSLLDRVVLYGGVLLAIILAVLSYVDLKRVQSDSNNLRTDINHIQSELNQLRRGLGPSTVAVTVTAARCPAGTTGSCCTQSSPMWGVDPHGNPYVATGDYVSWTFPEPGVTVEFLADASGSPFPNENTISNSGPKATSTGQVKLAASNYEWPYKTLSWGNNSCQHVVEPIQHRIWPPGLVMRPPP